MASRSNVLTRSMAVHGICGTGSWHSAAPACATAPTPRARLPAGTSWSHLFQATLLLPKLCLATLLQVGVRMSSATPAANSLGQLQRLSVRVGTLDTKPASVSLKLLYGRSVNRVIAVQIRIRSAIGAAAFANPRLGLTLTVNGTQTALALASTAEEMKDTIANALGGGWKGNANVQQYLGVRRMLESGGTGGAGGGSVLLVEIGADTSGSVTSGVSSLNIANVRLVQLPGPNIAALTNTSSCRFANPLAAPVAGSAAMEAFLRPSDPDVDFPGPLTDLAALIQTGNIQVADVAAAPAPREVAALAGTWALSLSNGTGVLQLPYDATAERVGQAVSALTGLQPSEVTVNDDMREGAYRARVWKVTFDGVYNYEAPLVMTAGPGLPADVLLAAEPNPGASWMYGKIRVSLGTYCDYVEFDPCEYQRLGNGEWRDRQAACRTERRRGHTCNWGRFGQRPRMLQVSQQHSSMMWWSTAAATGSQQGTRVTILGLEATQMRAPCLLATLYSTFRFHTAPLPPAHLNQRCLSFLPNYPCVVLIHAFTLQ